MNSTGTVHFPPVLSQNSGPTANSRLKKTASIRELKLQLEATNKYIRESGLGRTSSQSHNRFSAAIQANEISSFSTDDGISKEPETKESHSGMESSDEFFIKQFAHRCADYPGRKPILLDIEQSLKTEQQSQFPIILVFLLITF